jgi:hypothetical protein
VSALQHRESGHGEKRKRASTTEDLNQETHQTAAGERSAFFSLLSSCRAGSLMSNHICHAGGDTDQTGEEVEEVCDVLPGQPIHNKLPRRSTAPTPY